MTNELWFVILTFKDNSKRVYLCSPEEYEQHIAAKADEDQIGLRKVEIEVIDYDYSNT